jgi:hypothetical protein
VGKPYGIALCDRSAHSASIATDNRGKKTYNSGDSLVVTHLTTNPPVHCLSTAERTGSAEFSVLWSYVKKCCVYHNI